MIRTYYGQDDYNKVFRDSNVKDNYCAYVGLNKMGNRKRVVQSRPTQDDFCRFLRSIVDEPKEGEPRFNAYKEDKAYQRVVKDTGWHSTTQASGIQEQHHTLSTEAL